MEKSSLKHYSDTVKAVDLSAKESSRTDASLSQRDYKKYTLSPREILLCAAFFAAADIFISLLFFDSLIPALIAVPLFLPLLRANKNRLIKKTKRLLRIQFRDGISAYAAALASGYSAENAIDEALIEIDGIYGKKSMLSQELRGLQRGINVGRPVEMGLMDLAGRSGLDEIREMAQVFAIAKRSGGSLPAILRETIYMMDAREHLRSEITTMMTGKRLEQRIMCLVPAGMILYMRLTSPDFMAPLYESLTGRIIMTAALTIYAGAIMLGEKIMNVKV